MARTFDQILSDVTAQSDPQRKVILNQIADLPNQEAAAVAGAGAAKDQAYQDILSGARQRGLGFSGIPLAEQAKYDANTYAPAIANLKSTYAGQRGSLESALAGVGANDYTTANNIFNADRTFDEGVRQFNENLAVQKQAASRDPFAGLVPPTAPPQPADPYAMVDKQGAATSVVAMLKTNDPSRVAREISAIGKSAANGNLFDQYKIALLRQYMTGSQYGNLISHAVAGPSVARGVL
jgi:hypothetical protein